MPNTPIPGTTKEYEINSRTWTNVPLEANKTYSVTARENGQVIYVSDSPTGNNAVRLTKNFNIQTTGRTSLYLKGQSDLDIKIDEINATLVLKADKKNTYTKDEIDAMFIAGVSGAVTFKGDKAKLSDLYQLADAKLGDMWWVESEGCFTLCTDEDKKTEADGWTNVGSSVVNLADYYTKHETNTLLGAKADSAEIQRLETLIQQLQAQNDFDYVQTAEPDLANAKVGQLWLNKEAPSIKTVKQDPKGKKFWFDLGDNIEVNLATKFISLTKDQEVEGVKTFRTLPVTDLKPQNDNQLANKKYVDDAVANAGGGQGGLDPNNYYTKQEVDRSQTAQDNEINTLKEAAKKFVTMDTEQAIDAVKTFNQTPKVVNEPAAEQEVANKKYVDKKVLEAQTGTQVDLSNYYTKGEIDQSQQLQDDEITILKDEVNNCVTLDDPQTITGAKTFGVLPKSTHLPQNDQEFANKKYVDDAVANAGGGGAVDTSKLVTLDTEQEITALKTFTIAPKVKLMPTSNDEAANKEYIDTELNSLKQIFQSPNRFFVINGWGTWDTGSDTKVFGLKDFKVYCNGSSKPLKLKAYNTVRDDSPQSGGYDPLQYYCEEYILLTTDQKQDPATATAKGDLNPDYSPKSGELVLKLEPVTCWSKVYKGYYAFGFNNQYGWINGYPFLTDPNTETGKKEWSRYKVTPLFNSEFKSIDKIEVTTNYGVGNPLIAPARVDIYENMDVTDGFKPAKSYSFTKTGEQKLTYTFLNMKGSPAKDSGAASEVVTTDGNQTITGEKIFETLPKAKKGLLPSIAENNDDMDTFITRRYQVLREMQNRIVIAGDLSGCYWGNYKYWLIGNLELYATYYDSSTEIRLYPVKYHVLKDETEDVLTPKYQANRTYCGHEMIVYFQTTDPGVAPVEEDFLATASSSGSLHGTTYITLKFSLTSNLNAGNNNNSFITAFNYTGNTDNILTRRFQVGYPYSFQGIADGMKRLIIEPYIPESFPTLGANDIFEWLYNFVPFMPRLTRLDGIFGLCYGGSTGWQENMLPSQIFYWYESLLGPEYQDYTTIDNYGSYYYAPKVRTIVPGYNWSQKADELTGTTGYQLVSYSIDLNGAWGRFDKTWVANNIWKLIFGQNKTYTFEDFDNRNTFTQAEYDALSDAEKMNGKFYMIKG